MPIKKGLKKGPRENLAVENYSKLNNLFYKNYNGSHFDVKSFNLLSILSNTDECIKQNNDLEIKFGKISFKNTATVEEDREKFINYAKSELVSTYYHCLETFIRLFIAHSKLEHCPWIDIISLSIPQYKNCLDEIINGTYGFIKEEETIDNIIKYILTGISRDEDTKYIDNIKTWIIYAAHELKDIKGYNSLKHGLVNFNSQSGLKIKSPDNNPEHYFEKSGDTLQILKVVEKENRYVYSMDTEFVDYDILFLKIHAYSEMIENIITIGKAYYTEEKIEMVKGLSAGMYSYHDIMDFVLKGDENNLGRLVSNFSMELLYYKDIDDKNNNEEEKIMKKIYLVHCWDGTSNDGWYPWIEKQLNSDNVEVIKFDMPNTANPNINEWVSTLNSKVEVLNEDTYFIGHSIGCQTIMRYLETKEVCKIGGILFVAPWLDLLPEAVADEESYNTAQPWLNTPIDFDKIKQFTNNINCIFSSDDYFVSIDQEKEFKDKLNANTCIVENKGHISQDDDVFELQELLDLSNGMLNCKKQGGAR